MMKKELFRCKTTIDLEQYQNVFKSFPINFWIVVGYTSIIFLILSLIVGCISKASLLDIVIAFIGLVILTIIIDLIRIKDIDKTYYKRQLKNNPNTDFKYSLRFYDNYLVRESDNLTKKIYYNEIKEIREKTNDFYLRIPGLVLIVSKNNNSKDIINNIKKDNPKIKCK